MKNCYLNIKNQIIFHVIDSLNNSHCFSKVFAATSPNSPDTKYELEQNRNRNFRYTPGNGYVNDLNFLLQKMRWICVCYFWRFTTIRRRNYSNHD